MIGLKASNTENVTISWSVLVEVAPYLCSCAPFRFRVSRPSGSTPCCHSLFAVLCSFLASVCAPCLFLVLSCLLLCYSAVVGSGVVGLWFGFFFRFGRRRSRVKRSRAELSGGVEWGRVEESQLHSTSNQQVDDTPSTNERRYKTSGGTTSTNGSTLSERWKGMRLKTRINWTHKIALPSCTFITIETVMPLSTFLIRMYG